MADKTKQELRDEENLHDLADLVTLIDDYRWVWDIKLTKLITSKHWTQLPPLWNNVLMEMSSEKLIKLPDGYIESHWPDSLKLFITKCHQLKVRTTPPDWVHQQAVIVNERVKAGMKPKKLHEVSHLAGMVHCLCTYNNCDLVLDVGSGLGYLGQAITDHTSVSVVGLESDALRSVSAHKRVMNIRGHKEISTGATDNQDLCKELCELQFASLPMTVDQSPEFLSTISSLLVTVKARCTLLTGLHCCGDLSAAVLKLFTSQCHSSLQSVVLVPCCYHKMVFTPGGKTCSFPLSKAARSLMDSKQLLINCFGLRLAAQQSAKNWQSCSPEKRQSHHKHTLYRAILESVISNDSFPLTNNLSKQLAKAVRSVNHDNIALFTDQLLAALSQDSACHTVPENVLQRLHSGLQLQWKLYQSQERFIQALQACMQRAMESIVLLDYTTFLREEGMTAQLIPIFSEVLSPRCTAILATRAQLPLFDKM